LDDHKRLDDTYEMVIQNVADDQIFMNTLDERFVFYTLDDLTYYGVSKLNLNDLKILSNVA